MHWTDSVFVWTLSCFLSRWRRQLPYQLTVTANGLLQWTVGLRHYAKLLVSNLHVSSFICRAYLWTHSTCYRPMHFSQDLVFYVKKTVRGHRLLRWVSDRQYNAINCLSSFSGGTAWTLPGKSNTASVDSKHHRLKKCLQISTLYQHSFCISPNYLRQWNKQRNENWRRLWEWSICPSFRRPSVHRSGWPLSNLWKSFHHFWLIHPCDGQTDGQNCDG